MAFALEKLLILKLIKFCETMLRRFLCPMQAPKICKTRQTQQSYIHAHPRRRGP